MIYHWGKVFSKNRLFFIVAFFLAIFIVMTLLFADVIIAYSVNNLTDIKVKYAKWGSIFDRTKISGLSLIMPERGIEVLADETEIRPVDLGELGSGKLRLSCRLEGVRINPISAADGSARGGDIFKVISDPLERYDRVTFILVLGKNIFHVENFEARSENIILIGSYEVMGGKNDIKLSLKISLSPEISGKLGEDIRENVLSRDENGWYSTVVNYKGNPLFLKAVLSLS